MGSIVGCDISKAWFDVEVVDGSCERRLRIDNKAKPIDRFARELAPGSVVGMEATGQLHEPLAAKLVERGHTVFVINPRWIRQYARGLGIRGKTDRSDAALIARFVASEGPKLHPYEPPSPQHKELRKLLLQRRKLVELKVATQQSLGTKARALIGQFNALIAKLEQQIAEIIRSVPDWSELATRLRSEPGVGPVVAMHLVEVLTRMRFQNADAFIAHTGLDPRPNDSGQKRGRRFLTHHGDAALRSMLYMAAMKACQRGHWHAVYQAHRDRGLASTAALVVVARKLARIAFSLSRTGKTYNESVLPPVRGCHAT
jgi:transposase